MNSELLPANFTCSSHSFPLFHLPRLSFEYSFFTAPCLKHTSKDIKGVHALIFCSPNSIWRRKDRTGSHCSSSNCRFPFQGAITSLEWLKRIRLQGALLVGYKKGLISIITFNLFPGDKMHYSPVLGPQRSMLRVNKVTRCSTAHHPAVLTAALSNALPPTQARLFV